MTPAPTCCSCAAARQRLKLVRYLMGLFLALCLQAHVSAVAELPASYTNRLGMNFVLIPAGTYQMGRPETEAPDQELRPRYWVRLTRPFYLQSTEVTQWQWAQVMKGFNETPDIYFASSLDSQEILANRYTSDYNTDYESTYHVYEPLNTGIYYPIHYLTPKYTAYFLERLRQDGLNYRLPTDAEWEYAARAGQSSVPQMSELKQANCWADWKPYDPQATQNLSKPQADSDGFDNLAPVGSFKPNAWGLYDMVGNVNEFVLGLDVPVPLLSSARFPLIDPAPQPLTDRAYLVRGASLRNPPAECNLFRRTIYDDEGRFATGFRVLLDADSVRQTLK